MCQRKKRPPFLLAVRLPPVTPYDFPMPFPRGWSPSATLHCSTSARNTGRPVVDVRCEHGSCLGKQFCKSNVYHILLMTLYCRSNKSRQINVYYNYHNMTIIIICCESDDNMWLHMCELLMFWIHDPPNHHFRFLPHIQLNLQLPASPSRKGVSLSRFLPNKSCKRTFCSDCVRTSDIKVDLEHANDGPGIVSHDYSGSQAFIRKLLK